ncbi:MAG: cupredoxin domain-containing protein [Patescibacteria group bacterium]|jgi:plastocyanin domain-containing protein
MEKIIVTLFGIIGIAVTYWFFFKKEERQVEAHGTIHITVDGGYVPQVISIKNNSKTKIIFTRKDPNPCLEDVLIPDFKIKRALPLKIPVSVTLEPHKIGEYQLSCGMHMFHGKIIVHE